MVSQMNNFGTAVSDERRQKIKQKLDELNEELHKDVSASPWSHNCVMIGAQKVLDCRPHATIIFTGLDDTLTAKPISGRIYEIIRTTADCSGASTDRCDVIENACHCQLELIQVGVRLI